MLLILAAAGGFSLGVAVASMLVISKEQDDERRPLPLSSRFFTQERPPG